MTKQTEMVPRNHGSNGMSNMGSPYRPDEDEIKSICIGATCSLLLCPITFQMTSQKLSENTFIADFVGCLLTLILTIIIAFVSHIVLILRQEKTSNVRSRQHRTLLSQVFSLSPRHPIHQDKRDANNNLIYADDNNNNLNRNSSRRKIDPKYFKPKFIIHELMTFWDTTYTVVTWGSFYVIGGTIVVTERLANKIKTRCSREQSQQGSGGGFPNSSHHSSRRRESSFTSTSSTSETNSSIRSPLRRASSWTKKTFNSAKKKFTRFASSTAPPQLTADCPSSSSIREET